MHDLFDFKEEKAMSRRTETLVRLALLGLVVGLLLTDSVAFAAKIKGITAGKADKAVTDGIGTFWEYVRFVIPVIGVAAIIFGLWNAITTDRGNSSSVVSGLTAVGVGFVMVFVPIMITSGFATSGSEGVTLSERAAAFIASPPIDWGSPVTLLIILGWPVWRVFQIAKRRRSTGVKVVSVSS